MLDDLIQVFHRMELSVAATAEDPATRTRELAVLIEAGPLRLLGCGKCAFVSRPEMAPVRLQAQTEAALPLERVATPDADTIARLSECLGISATQTAKVVFLTGIGEDGDARTLMIVLRGDRAVSLPKVSTLCSLRSLRGATDAEVSATGAVPGYTSPIGLEYRWVVVDPSVAEGRNLVAGANATGYHLRNVNFGRDFQAQVVGDVLAAESGDACPLCGGGLQEQRGVVVGSLERAEPSRELRELAAICG